MEADDNTESRRNSLGGAVMRWLLHLLTLRYYMPSFKHPSWNQRILERSSLGRLRRTPKLNKQISSDMPWRAPIFMLHTQESSCFTLPYFLSISQFHICDKQFLQSHGDSDVMQHSVPWKPSEKGGNLGRGPGGLLRVNHCVSPDRGKLRFKELQWPTKHRAHSWYSHQQSSGLRVLTWQGLGQGGNN